jgi:pilus assembly protein CpaB
MQFQRTWSLIAAIALGAIGTIGLVAYVQQAHDNTTTGQLVTVYVATDKISAGTPADQLTSKIEQARVPTKVRADGAVTNLADLSGRTAAVDIVPGEQLLLSRFVSIDQQATHVQSSIPVPSGFFQTTVSLDPDQALGGQVRAGNRVAIVATHTSTTSGAVTSQDTTATLVARDVLVTTVQVDGKAGQTAGQSQQVIDAPTGKFLVTLAVTQQDLESVVSAVNDSNQGKIWLAADPSAR